MELGRPPIYDWESLLDEQPHTLVQGEDFHCRPISLRTLIYRTAADRGKRASVKVGNGKNGVAEGEVLFVARSKS